MRKLLLFIIGSFLILSAYSQLKKFTVEVPQPPKFEMPESIQSFTILNRSITPEFKNFDEHDLQVEFYKKNFISNTILLDSIASDSTIIALGDFLFESQRFDVVIPLERMIDRKISYVNTPKPLDWSFVEDICETYNTDALIVLENMAVRTVTNYETGTENTGFGWEKYHYASMDFYTRAHWRIYNPTTKKIQVDFIMNQDTIFWDHASNDLVDLFNVLPTIKEATIDSGIKLAKDFSDKIATKWIPATRYYYFMKNTEIDKSIKLAADGDWLGALENWLKYSNYGKSTTQSKIFLNIALAYEMNGDNGEAIVWAKKSLNMYYREVTNHYLKELLKRQAILN